MTDGLFSTYAERLAGVLASADWTGTEKLAHGLRDCWVSGGRVFLCGNGGSAANAIHLANDLLYGAAAGRSGGGLRVQALSANAAILTCLANDLGYDHIYSEQLAVHGSRGDILIALSGSGNSPNILKALEQAKAMGITSFAVLGFSGGKAKSLADVAIHFAVDDMQISEDMQLVVGHMAMQWLHEHPPARK